MKNNLFFHCTLFIILHCLFVLSCDKGTAPAELPNTASPFASFRDIPGATAEEIAAIEALQQAVLQTQNHSLIFGTPLNTEAFIGTDSKSGEYAVGGYIARYCDWLTTLLGIRITPDIFVLSDMLDKLTSRELDFGIVRGREELKKEYFVTDAIGQRMIIMMRIRGSEDINTISMTRLPRYVFLQASSTYDMVSEVLASGTCETLFAANYEAAYIMLKNGEADALIEANVIEGALEKYDDVYAENFLPLLFNPIVMITAKPELEPVISLVTKALQNGAISYLIRLYEEGNRDYMKHRMSVHLSDEEREYIASHPVVPFVANYDNYPTCFYNTREEEWQGIFFDILDEITAITGLSFRLINKSNDDWPVIYEMAKSGEASLIASLTWMREREDYFIWPETAMQPDYFSLISKSDYPDITIREIQNASVGVPRNTIHASMFRQWFPNHPKTIDYENMDGALLALQHGEVDLVMSSQRRLMYVTHFLELPGYRTNIVFDQPIQTISGFNKNEEVLCSIMDKSLKVIDIKGISDRWTRKTYDYRVKVAEARLPWLIGAATLSLITLALILTMIYRGRNVRTLNKARAIEKEAEKRVELMLEKAPLIALLWDDNFHLLDCNQEAARIFGLSDKKEFMERFFELLPEYQPNGMTSQELLQKAQSMIFKEKIEFAKIELTMNSVTGDAIPIDITIIRINDNSVLTYGMDLRELRASAAKMHETDERAQILFDTAPFAGCMFDKDLNLFNCNQEITKMFGIPNKEFFIDRFFELSPEYQPDGSLSAEGATKNIRMTFEKGYNRFEWLHKKPDGEHLPTEVTLVRVKYRDEYAIASYMRDLTEQKAMEQLTKMVMEKTSTLTAIFNSTPDMMFCKDINLYYTECNKAMENYFNIRNEEIIGKVEAIALNIPRDIAAHLLAIDKKVIAEKRIIGSEELVKSFDGRMLHFEMIRSPLIREGEVTGLVGIARDITQRKAAVENLNRQNSLMGTVNAAAAVLLEPDTGSSLATINRSMEMVCKSMDADRVYLWQNIRKDDDKLYYRKVCKWMRPEYTLVEELNEFTYEDTLSSWKNLFFKGKSINGPFDTIAENENKFFSAYSLQSLLAVPLFLKDELWGFISFDDCHSRHFFPESDEHILRSWGLLLVGAVQRGKIMNDLEHALAEAKRASAEAMKAYAEAETASEAKSRFVANMSHEMRTPMNVIVGLTDLMLEEKDVPAKIKETLEKINTAGSTLMGLINDVLDISKVEAGKLELIPVQYEVASLLNDVITLNMIRVEEKPITFKLDINEGLPSILFGDDMRVKQILNNLLSNAFKYTKKGTVTLGVDYRREGTSTAANNVLVSFSVSDTGIGIRPEDIAKLFSDYNQVDAKANRQIEGTGLGLSITKKMVELMDGEISVESEYGKGTTFLARIRQGYVTDKLLGKETVKNLQSFRYSEKKKRANEKLVRSDLSYARVLVVDDLSTNLDVAAGMLRKYKMHVDCVTNGKEAIEMIAAGMPLYDAVFMDHMMPGMDGIEATLAIRALGTKYAQDLPIIALTANVVAGNEQMFLANGFSAYLPKPFNVMLLDSVIQRWVRDKSRE